VISEYYRPKKISEALDLLADDQVNAIAMGGGTALDHYSSGSIAVVDLQDLGLDNLHARGSVLEIGATVALQNLLDHDPLQDSLKIALRHETSYNLRQAGTVAGTLVASDGRSPFTTAMLALDPMLILQPGEERISLGDLLVLREGSLAGKLITQIELPLNVRLAVRSVARTPADLPIIYAAVGLWPSGRTRVALGGFGNAPILAMDGPEKEGIETAARSAYSLAGDQWASAEYRQEMAALLVNRCIAELESEIDKNK
jgi:CO/xanthine dehydrogenase FAD-binding subunit